MAIPFCSVKKVLISPHPRNIYFLFPEMLALMIVKQYLNCGLICISLMISMLNIFSCAYWVSVSLYLKNVFLSPSPISKIRVFSLLLLLMLNCVSYLYILDRDCTDF